jgi:hypothetical protein
VLPRSEKNPPAELHQAVTDSALADTAFREQAGVTLLPENVAALLPSRAADLREALTRNDIRPMLELLVNLDIRGVGPGYDGPVFAGGVLYRPGRLIRLDS